MYNFPSIEGVYHYHKKNKFSKKSSVSENRLQTLAEKIDTSFVDEESEISSSEESSEPESPTTVTGRQSGGFRRRQHSLRRRAISPANSKFREGPGVTLERSLRRRDISPKNSKLHEGPDVTLERSLRRRDISPANSKLHEGPDVTPPIRGWTSTSDAKNKPNGLATAIVNRTTNEHDNQRKIENMVQRANTDVIRRSHKGFRSAFAKEMSKLDCIVQKARQTMAEGNSTTNKNLNINKNKNNGTLQTWGRKVIHAANTDLISRATRMAASTPHRRRQNRLLDSLQKNTTVPGDVHAQPRTGTNTSQRRRNSVMTDVVVSDPPDTTQLETITLDSHLILETEATSLPVVKQPQVLSDPQNVSNYLIQDSLSPRYAHGFWFEADTFSNLDVGFSKSSKPRSKKKRKKNKRRSVDENL